MGMGQMQSVSNQVASRIESDVECVKKMTAYVESTTSRIVRHARALGYYEAESDAKVSAPTPVVTSLADALQALDRAIEHCSGALNVFD